MMMSVTVAGDPGFCGYLCPCIAVDRGMLCVLEQRLHHFGHFKVNINLGRPQTLIG